MRTKYWSLSLAALLLGGMALAADDFEAKRAEMLNRKREIIYNTDGCDAIYYPRELAASKENFINRRLVYTQGTAIDSVFYCPLSSGFGHLTYRTTAGDQLLADPPHAPKMRNVTGELLAMGTDPLKIAEEYCREQGLEFFASLRVNDTHDQGHTEEKPMFLMSPFKRQHPEFLLGSKAKPPKNCSWSAADFTHKEVRDRMAAIVAEICANYDIDGIEYDFMRHMQLLKSVADGGTASPRELKMMTDFMKELREITEAAGRKRGRPILVAIRVPDSVEYCRAVGIDLEQWMKEKLFDIMIGASYFQLNPWRVSAELAHKYGIKFYASLDESRIQRKGVKYIPGRGGRDFYLARSAAAMADGCDGVYHFNLEYKGLRDITRTPLDQLDRYDKVYYATERGSGGYRSFHFLREGDRFNNLPKLDPGEPLKVVSGKPLNFSITIGDDTASPEALKRDPAVTAELLVDAPQDAKISLSVNGREFAPTGRKDGLVTFSLAPESIKKGANDFAVTIDASGNTELMVRDFCVRIKYAPTAPEGLEQAASEAIEPIVGVSVVDGKAKIVGKLRNSYKPKFMPVENGVIKLIHDSGEKGADYMRFSAADPQIVQVPPRVLVAEWRLRIPAENGEEQPSFQIVLAPPRKSGKGDYEISYRFTPTRMTCNQSVVQLPGVDFTQWNTYRLALDTSNGAYALWVNGKIRQAGVTSAGADRENGFCHIGDGSAGIGGKAELAYVMVGTCGIELAPELEPAASGAITPVAGVAVVDGKAQVTGKLKNGYKPQFMPIEDGAMKLIHDSGEKGADYMRFTINDPALFKTLPPLMVTEWKLRIPAENGEEQPSFQVALAPPRKSGEGSYEVFYRFTPTRVICNRGEVKFPGVDLRQWNTFRVALDTGNGAYALWINGKLMQVGTTTDGAWRKTPFCHIGDASGQVGGKAELAYLTIGTVAE